MNNKRRLQNFLVLASFCPAITGCTVANDGGAEADSSSSVPGSQGGAAGNGKGGRRIQGPAGAADTGALADGGINSPPTSDAGASLNPVMNPVPAPPASTPAPPVGGPATPEQPPPVTPTPPLPPPQPPVAPPVRATAFDFESDTQGWQDLQNSGATVSRTMARAATGSSSLEVSLNVPKSAKVAEVYIGVPRNLTPALRAGQSVRYRVWVPANSQVFAVQPFVVTQGNAQKNGRWAGSFNHIDTVKPESWNEFVVTLPADYEVDQLEQVGVQLMIKPEGWKGSVWIDSVFF